MNRILFAVFRKEMIHIFRDLQSLFMVLTMPVLMLFLYGYAITLEMRRIDTAVIDESHTPESRNLIAHISSSGFFRLTAQGVALSAVDDLFKTRTVRCALVVPQDYARSLADKARTEVQLIIDASDPNAANFIDSYFRQILAMENSRADGRGGGTASVFSVDPRILYNPDMRSAAFFVPGLIAVILLLISTLLTSIAIAREKESGTMEQILVSPVRPYQIIIGKVLPYTLIGFIDGILILLFGSFWFRIPIEGSFLLALAMMLIYTVTGISLGILVSTLAKTQAVAMLGAVSITILPSILMSGFIFPVSSMPRIFQYVSAAVPATYFLQIIRGIILKGNTFANIAKQAGILLCMDVLLIVLSVRFFRKRLG